jgi:hypothetical protein
MVLRPTNEHRYDGRPLLRLLDSYVLALTSNLDRETELKVAKMVRATFGRGADWMATLRRAINLPDDMDRRIRELWRAQPPGTDPSVFAVAVSDDTFAPLIDRE